MPITLGNPTAISAKARENQILSTNASLTSDPVVANPILRARRDTTTLVDFPLDPTTPLTGGAVDGSAAFNFVSASVPATGGAATVPNNYQLIGRDSAVHWAGPITADIAITVAQMVNASSIVGAAPAS